MVLKMIVLHGTLPHRQMEKQQVSCLVNVRTTCVAMLEAVTSAE